MLGRLGVFFAVIWFLYCVLLGLPKLGLLVLGGGGAAAIVLFFAGLSWVISGPRQAQQPPRQHWSRAEFLPPDR